MCEFEKLILEGRRGKSHLSPTGILSHLRDIGSSFGPGREEDAHEFLRYAIDTMQSASMKEAKKNGVYGLPEETTLVQLIFGGYLRSKIKCTMCQGSSEQCERILDLTVEIDGDINTLEEALHRFTSTEILDGDNRYNCSRCKSYERAKKKLTISEAPNILTIALKRYQVPLKLLGYFLTSRFNMHSGDLVHFMLG
jgi:ubiquitin carboxyl-terminal hydrolase 36/42